MSKELAKDRNACTSSSETVRPMQAWKTDAITNMAIMMACLQSDSAQSGRKNMKRSENNV